MKPISPRMRMTLHVIRQGVGWKDLGWFHMNTMGALYERGWISNGTIGPKTTKEGVAADNLYDGIGLDVTKQREGISRKVRRFSGLRELVKGASR